MRLGGHPWNAPLNTYCTLCQRVTKVCRDPLQHSKASGLLAKEYRDRLCPQLKGFEVHHLGLMAWQKIGESHRMLPNRHEFVQVMVETQGKTWLIPEIGARTQFGMHECYNRAWKQKLALSAHGYWMQKELWFHRIHWGVQVFFRDQFFFQIHWFGRSSWVEHRFQRGTCCTGLCVLQPARWSRGWRKLCSADTWMDPLHQSQPRALRLYPQRSPRQMAALKAVSLIQKVLHSTVAFFDHLEPTWLSNAWILDHFCLHQLRLRELWVQVGSLLS